jgi:hypothetical protein
MREKREGPNVITITTYDCCGCKFMESEKYTCQSDWGFDYYCKEPDTEEANGHRKRRIGDNSTITPDWCPFKKVSNEAEKR